MMVLKKPPTSPTKSLNAPADADGFCQNEMTRNIAITVTSIFFTVGNVTGVPPTGRSSRLATGGRCRGSANEQ